MSPKLIYDVGLHQGEDTDFYLKKGFRVVAFEANPELAALCRQRFAAPIQQGLLTIVEGAIVERDSPLATDGRVSFHKYAKNTGWGTVAGDWVDRNTDLGKTYEVIEVPTIDFAQQLQQHGIPHYLKIDIEGMDRVCLHALREFDHKPAYVSIESEKVSFAHLREELDLLEQLGYNAFQAVQQKRISRQHEPKPAREGQYVGHRFLEGASGLFGGDLPDAWHSRAEVEREYEAIFYWYERFGDRGRWKKHLPGKALRAILSLVLQRPIPGWYDTHARHQSVS